MMRGLDGQERSQRGHISKGRNAYLAIRPGTRGRALEPGQDEREKTQRKVRSEGPTVV